MPRAGRLRLGEVASMSVVYWEILFIALLIGGYGLLALAKFAVEGARPSILKEQATRGDRGAVAALALSENPDRLLGTIQAFRILLATLVGVVAGLGLQPPLSRELGRVAFLAPYRDGTALAIIVVTIALAALVFGELVPRRIALYRPERIAGLAGRPLRGLALVVSPLVGGLSRATDLVLQRMGVRPVADPSATQEEIAVLIDKGTKSGVFEEEEHELIKRVFRFSDRRARTLMTPRSEVVWIDPADSPDEVRRKVTASPHSRFPVCDQGLDNLLGVVQIKDFLAQNQCSDAFRIKGRLTMPLFMYEGTRGLKILEMFRKSATRFAVVLDEYGTVEGVLTLTDIIEAIVGDMPAAPEEEEPAAVQRSDGSWLLDGRMLLDDFWDLFGLPVVPQGDFHTVAGFVVNQLGRIPRIAESFDAGGLYFEVVDMDGNRVDRILVKRRDTQDQTASVAARP
jgi:putative hemolysin